MTKIGADIFYSVQIAQLDSGFSIQLLRHIHNRATDSRTTETVESVLASTMSEALGKTDFFFTKVGIY